MTISRSAAASIPTVLLLLAACGSDSKDPSPGGGCSVPGSVTTTLAAGNSHNGNMFDVVAIRDVVVTGLTANISPSATVAVAVYERPGSHVGHETVSADWTLAGTATITGAASGPTAIPLSLSVSIAAATRHAFYVTATDGTTVGYTNGTTVGAVAAEDANLQVLEGTGNGYPFGSLYQPRIYNGTVSYLACP